jgi:nucleoside-diphosphate kinase
MVWEGEQAIALVRQTMGATRPWEAAPGTVRADYGITTGRNLVHGSDGPESAAREVALFFEASEIVEWEQDIARWTNE